MKKITTLLLATAMVLMFSVAAMAETLMMATTTSTVGTGLLDELIVPMFKKDTGIDIKYVGVGTGKALKMAKNGDVDVVLVHAPGAEKKCIKEGFLMDRREVMYNDFVIIGPKTDPAGIKGMAPDAALKQIAEKKATFTSRGDNSGTNKKEILLWKNAGMTAPDGQAWYVQTGQGMIATINVAEEKGGYTMTDRGTYIKYSANKDGNPALIVVVEDSPVLFNQYSVLPVNPKVHPKAKYALATKFSNWMASPATQKAIGDFRLLGQPLFIPNAK